jgi:hypothetical protein
MNWLNARFEQERREDEIRALQHEAKMQALLDDARRHGKTPRKNVRRAVGGKLVEWGERLQDGQSLPGPSLSES